MLKRIVVLALFAAFGLYFIPNASAQDKIKIGIVLSSDQPHYIIARDGVLEQLKKEGFDDSKVDFYIQIGDGKLGKAAEIAKELKEKRVILFIPIGTPAAIGVAQVIKDIPVVFTLVFDPVSSGIAKSWESSGNNTAGTSTWVNMDSIVRMLRKICPAKRIGVIYTEGEKNTVIQLDEFKKIQEKMNFIVVPAELSKPENAEVVINGLIGKVDSIFVTGGTVVGESLVTIVGIAKKAKIPTVTHLPDRIGKGVLLAMSADTLQLAQLAAKKAAQVLKGANPAYMPIETLEQYDIIINMNTAEEMGLVIPDSILKSVKKVTQPVLVSAPEKIKIGIIVTSNQPQLLTCLKGVLGELKKEGFDETKVNFDIRYALLDRDKIVAAAKDFKEKRPELIITLGTPAAIVVHEEIKDTPVVFTQMFDPLGAKIIKSWESSGNNFTGSSNWLDLTSLIKTIRKVIPVKRIGVVYNEKEENSLSQLNQFNLLQNKLDFNLIPANLLKSEDAKIMAESLIGKVDSVYITGSNLVGENIKVILGVLNKAKIPTVAHLQGKAEEGVLLVLAVDSFQLGELAGKKAAQVLRGIKPSLIPVEMLEQWDITINMKTAKEIGLEIPESFLKTASKIIK